MAHYQTGYEPALFGHDETLVVGLDSLLGTWQPVCVSYAGRFLRQCY